MNQKLHLSILLVLWFFISVTYGQTSDLMTDIETCTNATVGSCANTVMKTSYYQCCESTKYSVSGGRFINPESQCLPMTDVEYAKTKVNSASYKAIMKESFGFIFYGFFDFDVLSNEEKNALIKTMEEMSYKIEYTCKDGVFSYTFGVETYSSSEIQTFKSQNHCMRYFYSYTLDENFLNSLPSENQCFNAELLQSSKDAGLTCAYLSFSYTDQSGTQKTYSTCYPMDFSEATLDDKTKEAFTPFCSAVVDNIIGGQCLDSTFKIKAQDGKEMCFNTLTGEVSTQCGSSTTTTPPSSSSERFKVTVSLIVLLALVLV